MSHPTLDQLLTPGPEEAEHLASCPSCRVEVRLAQSDESSAPGLEQARDAMEHVSRNASLSMLDSVHPGMGLQTGERLSIGDVVDGRWVVDSVLGRGGVGTVYLVRHKLLGSQHALKVLHLHTKELRSRLLREGRAQATLGHPNVVQVSDVVEVGGAPALVMEFVDGGSLRKVAQMLGPLDMSVCHAIAGDVLAGVAAAHANDLVHRDLKPENVLIEVRDDGLTARVTDFGLAKMLSGPAGSVVTRKGRMLGTPAYMAPEQLMSAADVDARADVFALGALLYELYTGRRALLGFSSLDLRMGLAGATVRPPSTLRGDLPVEIERAILGALEPRKELRPPLALLSQAFQPFRSPHARLSELDLALWRVNADLDA